MPVCAWVDGQYGISGVYVGAEEALLKAAEAVRAEADVRNLQ